MIKLAKPLRVLIEPGHDYRAWYLCPPPEEREPSVLYNYATNMEVLIWPRHRVQLEQMVVVRIADQRAGGDRACEGARTVAQWAAIFGCQKNTVSHYRREIELKFANLGVNAYATIFERVRVNGWNGVRIRPELTIVRLKPVQPARVTSAGTVFTLASTLLHAVRSIDSALPLMRPAARRAQGAERMQQYVDNGASDIATRRRDVPE